MPTAYIVDAVRTAGAAAAAASRVSIRLISP